MLRQYHMDFCVMSEQFLRCILSSGTWSRVTALVGCAVFTLCVAGRDTRADLITPVSVDRSVTATAATSSHIGHDSDSQTHPGAGFLPFSADASALAHLPSGVGATGSQMHASATQSSTITAQSLTYLSFISASGHLDLVNPSGSS